MSSSLHGPTKAANLDAWNANSSYWDGVLGDDGNDFFQQLILPGVRELIGGLKQGDRVLDLGTGNGMIARDLARDGIEVVATDYSAGQLELASIRASKNGKHIKFQPLDLMDVEDLDKFAKEHTGEGRVVFVNLHPCFHKPAGHRVMELYEDPMDGVQKQIQWIKVMRYLDIGETQSEALRGQPQPLMWFHRPIHALLNPFAAASLCLKEVREPSFADALKPGEIQSYHNYPQIPMLFTFMLTKVT
ncbi:hypothetical protein LTR27_012430 [Elasticomyces elasticus]|nr:hypothetical protein LTR27_012430 [Elasticomyces elasticus]